MISLLLVDDDALVRAGLQLILGGRQDLSIVGEATDGQQALSAFDEAEDGRRPDIVLMDIRMPRMDGLAATEQLLSRPDPPRIIVLTTFDTDDLVLQALRLGASGFLLKDTPPQQLIEAIHAVAEGKPMLSPSVTAQLISTVAATGGDGDQRRERARVRLRALTEREREVARAIGAGRSNAEIAAQLYLSIATVKAHVGRLFEKLPAENRVQIAICVHDAELD